MTLLLGMTTFAEKKEKETVIDTSNEIIVHPEKTDTRTVAPCPIGGSHRMLPMGIGYARYKDTDELLIDGDFTL